MELIFFCNENVNLMISMTAYSFIDVYSAEKREATEKNTFSLVGME